MSSIKCEIYSGKTAQKFLFFFVKNHHAAQQYRQLYKYSLKDRGTYFSSLIFELQTNSSITSKFLSSQYHKPPFSIHMHHMEAILQESAFPWCEASHIILQIHWTMKMFVLALVKYYHTLDT